MRGNQFSRFFSISLLIASVALGKFASPVHAQSQASCTFSFFPLSVNLSGGAVNFSPAGINDFGTVVGSADMNGLAVGAIRWKNGGFTFANGTTELSDRNDSGISIGYTGVPTTPGAGASLVNGTRVVSLKLNNIPSPIVFISGINNWGSTVGTYFGSVVVYGFKRWKNGNAFTLLYPGSGATWPASIDDRGTVIGSYYVGPPGIQLPENGFIYHNGQWATLNYPNTAFTHLVGISNAGVIVGNAPDGSAGGFLYANGGFKVISAPDGSQTNLIGMSPKLGLILGTVSAQFVTKGFIAKCQ